MEGRIPSTTLRARTALGIPTSTCKWLEVLGHDEDFGDVVDWFLALPLEYNQRERPAFQCLPKVEERTDVGLEPKLPHLYELQGSTLVESQYISTSRCPVAALFYAMKSYARRQHEPDDLKVAGIGLGPMNGIGGVREHAYIYDMSKLELRMPYLKIDKACNYARKFEEALLEGIVPPSAVIGYMSLSTICALVRDPQLLERLRTPVCSGFDSFHDACRGAVENGMRRHFGLPILANVQPERAVSNIPVRAQRPIPAKYEQACRRRGHWISKRDLIVNASPRGSSSPPKQATGRGGMHARLNARNAALARDILSESSDPASIPGTHDTWLYNLIFNPFEVWSRQLNRFLVM